MVVKQIHLVYLLACGIITISLAAFLPGCSTANSNSGSDTSSQRSDDTISVPLRLLDLADNEVNPFQETNTAITLFLFTRTDCPISNRYAPEIRRLYDKFSPQNVIFWLVYLDPDETVETIRQHIADYSYPCAALRDPQHTLVKMTGARVTPEAAVFVAERKMVYRGRIDDRYVDFGKARAAPTTHDLEQALEAVLSGNPVAESTTSAVGCYIADLK